MKKILVTGSAGFIGMHLCESLLLDGHRVLGIDNLNEYYDVNLKKDRLKLLKDHKGFSFIELDITDQMKVDAAFKNFNPDKVVNLAAQAGVGYSLVNPHAYINSNIKGFMNILEASKNLKVKGLIYASSASVYGGNEKKPFSENDFVDKPISMYAVSKKTNELMAHTYSHLHGLKTTGLRFFSAYGPWGRPDMAMYIFSEKICRGQPINVFNNGNMFRDFTFIEDVVKGVKLALVENFDCEVFNLGYGKSQNLMDMIKILESCLDKKVNIKFKEIMPGDVQATHADISRARDLLGYIPSMDISVGIPKFVNWFKSYHNYK